MMSISPPMKAEQAGGYFTREDYYLGGSGEANSRWCGRGAEALGLEGEVREQEFRALCRGEDPAGTRIVKHRELREKGGGIVEHRAGNDCTFSAPKSVSIAYAAGVEGIKEAHDVAVFFVLEHMEGHYCHYRSSGRVLNGRMVAAKFDHATSRNFDPQLHSHVFLVNVVQTRERGWKANETRAIFQDQKSLGLLYRQELARELTERGIVIAITNRSLMYFELAGVDSRLIDYFSSRRREIEEQVGLWQAEGKFSGVPHARLYEMATLETRDPKHEMDREELVRVFERGFEACGTSLERVRRELEEARAPFLTREREPTEPATRVVELVARDLTSREAVLDRARLLDQAVRVSGGAPRGTGTGRGHRRGGRGGAAVGPEHPGAGVLHDFSDAGAGGREPGAGARPGSLSKYGGREGDREVPGAGRPGGRPAHGRTEEGGCQRAHRGERARPHAGRPGDRQDLHPENIERFNEEVLLPDGRGHLSINAACTGKAARELGLATGRPAFTVDSLLLGWEAPKFDLQKANAGPIRLIAAGEEILIFEGRQVVLRVDEASFLGARQAEGLLRMVEELKARGVQAKLHLVGDTKQMQAIQAGGLLHQCGKSGSAARWITPT